ncbi:MAG: hypothetical protein IKQ46_01770 [Bacteroidales bacterium]|nr:hypothetical protein [Bacteroidales bacterium]
MQLEEVERLFLEHKDSLAFNILDKIIPPTDSTFELALYNYLIAKKQIHSSTNIPSSFLNFSEEYFRQTNDSLRLAFVYNYKSIFLLGENNKIESNYYNLEAEKIAEKLDDNILKFNVFSSGYYLAAYNYDTEKCLSYARKAYFIGQKLDDLGKMAYPAIYLTLCYNEKNEPDSVKKYMAVCLNYLNDYREYSKGFVFNMLGDVFSKTDKAMSEFYYLESIAINHNADAYNGLTRLYLSQNKLEKADTCFKKALRHRAYEANLKLMNLYADKLIDLGCFIKALNIKNQISLTQDSLYNEKIVGLNNQIEILKENESQKKVYIDSLDYKLLIYRILILVFLFIIILSFFYIYRKFYKVTVHVEQLSEKTLPLDKVSIKSDEISSENGELLNSEFNLSDNLISIGQQLYEKVSDNKSIRDISKKNRDLFVAYYYSIYPDFAKEIFMQYNGLSINSELLLIFQNMGKNKQEIIDIMGFSDQAYRSLKSRTDKAKKEL